MAPPGFDVMRKAEQLFDGVDARLINLDQVLEQSLGPAGICDGLPKESLCLDTIDGAAFDLKDLSMNRVIIGCPRTLK